MKRFPSLATAFAGSTLEGTPYHRSASRNTNAHDPRRPAVATMVLAALALLAAACGGSPSSNVSGGATNAGGSTISHKALSFAGCMRSHGVANFPDPNSSGQFNKTTLAQLADSNSQYQAAQRSCQHLLPTRTAAQQQQSAEQALEFSRCIRSHGVANFPDPDSSGRIPDPASLGIDQGSPRFEAANQACGKYRPPYVPSNAAYNAYARTHGT